MSPDYLASMGQHWVLLMLGDAIRYVIFATSVWLLLWYVLARPLANRRIRSQRPPARQLRKEFVFSMRSVMIFSTVSLVAKLAQSYFGWWDGPKIAASWGQGWFWASLILMIVAHDAYFYWAHRFMHHPRLFKHFHRAHHRSITPTPWAAYSFAMPEAAVMFLFVPLWQFFVPTPGWVLFTWLNFQIIRNAMGHAGFEFFPRWWLDSPLTRWINTTVHHDLHHNGGFNTNYGLYFTWWDRWMGTEHPRYHEKFGEVTGRTQPIAAQASSKVTA